MNKSFKKTKEILTSKLIVKPFDINLPTILITDASRLNGMGFALIKKEKRKTIISDLSNAVQNP